MNTRAERNAIEAIAEVIHEEGSVAYERLYKAFARVLGINEFAAMIRHLVNTGRVIEDGGLLVWNAQQLQAA